MGSDTVNGTYIAASIADDITEPSQNAFLFTKGLNFHCKSEGE